MPILARIKVGQGYGRVVVDSDVWVLNTIDQSLSRVDDQSNTVKPRWCSTAETLLAISRSPPATLG